MLPITITVVPVVMIILRFDTITLVPGTIMSKRYRLVLPGER